MERRHDWITCACPDCRAFRNGARNCEEVTERNAVVNTRLDVPYAEREQSWQTQHGAVTMTLDGELWYKSIATDRRYFPLRPEVR